MTPERREKSVAGPNHGSSQHGPSKFWGKLEPSPTSTPPPVLSSSRGFAVSVPISRKNRTRLIQQGKELLQEYSAARRRRGVATFQRNRCRTCGTARRTRCRIRQMHEAATDYCENKGPLASVGSDHHQVQRRLFNSSISAPVSILESAVPNQDGDVNSNSTSSLSSDILASDNGNCALDQRVMSFCVAATANCHIPCETEPPALLQSKKMITRLETKVTAQVHLIEKLRNECDSLRVKVRACCSAPPMSVAV